MSGLMTPDLLTAAGGAVTAVLTAWNAKQGKKLRELEGKTAQLETWRTVAIGYIGTLLFLLAERGIQPPQPPKELGLTLTVNQPKEE
ncbi:hypothetical protein Lesp02_83940 [Lentzea sp. NBRC 105346]|uniref:hypothetical protein n=1 Tax=Lentzea sp. NBRC 105346 TaxID=3032205 RepID=UPI0024A0614E|nr:hypothetical protein [Lentzea sp. NBRC 105346]GLZ36207.1 hypothetical protein Lesp02_83940 [Lentzea sp. NBRC 105346]